MKFRVLISACLLAACVESGGHHESAPVAPNDAGTCQDRDGDGYGENCDKGGDCNDDDPKVHTGCSRCVTPQQGCDCEVGSKPVSCYLTPSANEEGTVMCHEGTRYCRNREWSSCESVVSYPRPALADPTALVAPDAGPVRCNDCNVNCYVVRDNLDPVDAGYSASTQNAVVDDGGGISLKYSLPDASTMTTDAGTFNPSTCVLGTAPDHDCDGIPDQYDPYPNQKPFATANPTIFLDIAPGETGTGVVNVQFFLNSADVYFYIDQTGSMQGESDQLKLDLTTGDFINDASYQCSDYDFDLQPNNELKSQGIIGAIRCIIRDANFGVGYFREIPFYSAYAQNDNILYRNLQDITSSVPAVISGVSQLYTVTNIDWPEADMVGLYSVVTGSGQYFGTNKPGLPARTDCPGTTWGYPCFRSNAIPIVVMFTDAQMHNGPSSNTYPYNSAYLGISKGTNASYTTVTPTNEDSASAYDFGTLGSTLTTYIGSTKTMVSDFGHNAVPCGSSANPNAPDAMFKFTLSSTQTVTLASAGSDFNTTISLYNGTPGVVVPLPTLSNTNDTVASAFAFGDITNQYLQASGSTSSLVGDYSPNDVSCSAYPGAKDATFSFSLAQPLRVALDTTSSTIGTVVSLFSSAPTASSYTAIANTNDTFASAYAAGTVNGKDLGFSGDSSAAGITPSFTGAQLGCTTAPADTATDSVYSFTLTSPTRVRVSTEDTSFANVIALVDNNGDFITTIASANTNELDSSATDVGALDNKVVQYTGSTSGMVANYAQSVIGCNAGDTSKDAVYKFSLASTKTISLDTTGSGYDTTLALFRDSVSGTSSPITLTSNANETGVTGYDLGTANAKKYVVTGGNTSSMAADYTSTQIGCSTTNSSATDAVFKFHLNTGTRVRVDTIGTSYDALLSLHNGPLPDLAITTITSNTNEDQTTALAVATSTSASNLRYDGNTQSMNTDVTVDNGAGCSATGRDAVFKLTVPASGSYELNTIGSSFDTVLGLFKTSTASGNLIACDNDSGSSTALTSKITTSLSAGTYYAVVKGRSSSKRGRYSLAIKALDYINAANRVTCDDDSAGASQAKIEQDLVAGDYYVVVKGHSSSTYGSYTLTVQDITTPPVSTEITCNDDVSASSNSSFISQALTAGTYYVVVKGHLTASGAYKLTLKDTSVTTASVLQCDSGSGVSGTSLIERDLTAGTYRVIFKGKASTNKGAYKLILRDLTALPNNQRIGCDHNSGTGGKSHYEADLAAGTYYAVVKGDSSTAGSYKLSVRDATHIPTDAPLQCNYNGASDGTSYISTSLGAGTYYALLKGYNTTDLGQYQLSIGTVAATSSTYVPPTWAQTLAALQAKSVHVMTVLSCHDDPQHGDVQGDCVATRTQATALANATGALGASLQPLVFDINGDGSGLSSSVVQGISALAHYLEMNVQARVVFDPDANPGFGVSIKAVHVAGDGCSSLVGNEFMQCVPGATPRFEISFTNPLSAPVPRNPNDPNGGYNFRVELIGDDEFIVDRVPVYIIPADVTHPPANVPQVASSGSYWQNISAPGCTGNQRPDWHDLSWTADVPSGTTLSFSVCASDKTTDLTNCPLIPLCTVTGGAACTSDAQCANGFCSTGGNCQTISMGNCVSDSQCLNGSSCHSNVCTFPGQPIYIGGVLGSANYDANLRMQIGLTGNTVQNTGPTLHDWSLTYVCNNIL
jgi:hypothetical protein